MSTPRHQSCTGTHECTLSFLPLYDWGRPCSLICIKGDHCDSLLMFSKSTYNGAIQYSSRTTALLSAWRGECRCACELYGVGNCSRVQCSSIAGTCLIYTLKACSYLTYCTMIEWAVGMARASRVTPDYTVH